MSRDEALERLGRELATAQDEAIAMRRRIWRARVRERVLDHVPSRRAKAPWVAAAAVVAAAVLAGVWVTRPETTSLRPLAARSGSQAGTKLAQASAESPHMLRAPEHARIVHKMAAGSIELEPNARVELDPSGGRRMVVHEGSARLELATPDAEAWAIQAGDVELRVSSATFRVEVGGAVHMKVERGVVEVQSAPYVGRTFTRGDVVELRGERTTKRSARARRATSASWDALASKGDFRGAWASAERDGIASLASSLPADALLRLADVARYVGQRQDARTLLLAARKRFPGTSVAATAAFDLARLDSSKCGRSLAWLETYLEEQPNGTMVAEANARLSECEPAH